MAEPLHGETKWSRFIGRRRGNEARLRRMKHWEYEAPLRGMKRSLTASLFFARQKMVGVRGPHTYFCLTRFLQDH